MSGTRTPLSCRRCGERFYSYSTTVTLCGLCMPRGEGTDWKSAAARLVKKDKDDA